MLCEREGSCRPKPQTHPYHLTGDGHSENSWALIIPSDLLPLNPPTAVQRMQNTEKAGGDHQRLSGFLVLAAPLCSECCLECSSSSFSTKKCLFSLLGNVVFGMQWWLTIVGHQLLPQFTGEITLTFVFMLSFTTDMGKRQLYPVIWRTVLSSWPEGTGSCIFRTGQNTLIKATSAFPTDTDAL